MKTNQKSEERVLALLLMRFKISPPDSFSLTQKWLKAHPEADWLTLESSLKNQLIRVENGELIDLYEQRIIKLVNDLRGEEGLEIKDRRYRLTLFPSCFIGSEAVEWMEKQYAVSKSEALRLGQELIQLKIIYHVTNDHDFKNDFLFYRFYVDE